MSLDKAVLEQLAKVLQEQYSFATQRQLNEAITDLGKRVQSKAEKGNAFSFSRAIRGSLAIQGHTIDEKSRDADITYVRALTPASGAGSFLVPTIQAGEIIEMLSTGSVVRRAGARIWPMTGTQKMNVPTALASPTFQWLGPNSASTASDPDLGQVILDLKQMRALVAVPNQLLRVSHPLFDQVLSDILAKGAGEFEDAALLASSDVANGPKCYYNASAVSKIFVGGSPSGGSLAYTDLLAVLAKAETVKAKPPFVWLMSPRTFYQRVLGMLDTTSRPLVIPTLNTGLYGGIQYNLFGWPVFISPAIAENETNSSGSSQSHIIFTNPSYLMLADGQDLSVLVSTERYFEFDQTAIRLTHSIDSAVAPAAGCVILAGVN